MVVGANGGVKDNRVGANGGVKLRQCAAAPSATELLLALDLAVGPTTLVGLAAPIIGAALVLLGRGHKPPLSHQGD